MPCDTIDLTEFNKRQQREALDKLRRQLADGSATVIISANGAIAFKGWSDQGKGFLYDVCAYRKLLASNSPELRRAVARAEAVSGRKVNQATIAAGVHSHDGGTTWGKD